MAEFYLIPGSGFVEPNSNLNYTSFGLINFPVFLQSASTTGISSAESFGSTYGGVQTLSRSSPTGWIEENTSDPITKASPSGWYQTSYFVNKDLSVSTSGFSSGTFGTPTATLYVATTGLGTGLVFGTPNDTLFATSTGLGTGLVFGTSTNTYILLPSGLGTSNAFGSVSYVYALSPSGLPSDLIFGYTSVASQNLSRPSENGWITELTTTLLSNSTPTGWYQTAFFYRNTSPVGIPSAESFGSISAALRQIYQVPTLGFASVTNDGLSYIPGIGFVSRQLSNYAQYASSIGIPTDLRIGSVSDTLYGITSSIGTAGIFGSVGITYTLLPSGITSAGTFGSVGVTYKLFPIGIPSGVVFGTANQNANIQTYSITSSSGFGSVGVTAVMAASTLAIPNPEEYVEDGYVVYDYVQDFRFGTISIQAIPNEVLLPIGITSGLIFGGKTVIAASTLAIPNPEEYVEDGYVVYDYVQDFRFGTISIQAIPNEVLLPIGITSGLIFGGKTVIANISRTTTGIASDSSIGSIAYTLGVSIPTIGLATDENYGSVSFSTSLPIAVLGFTEFAFGGISYSTDGELGPLGIASDEAFGINSFTVDIGPVGFTTAAIGSITAKSNFIIHQLSLDPLWDFGTANLKATINKSTIGFTDTVFGSISLTLQVNGFTTAAIGSISANAYNILTLSGINTSGIGSIVAEANYYISTIGLDSDNEFGFDIVDQTITTNGFVDEIFGSIKYSNDYPSVGISSSEVFGFITVTPTTFIPSFGFNDEVFGSITRSTEVIIGTIGFYQAQFGGIDKTVEINIQVISVNSDVIFGSINTTQFAVNDPYYMTPNILNIYNTSINTSNVYQVVTRVNNA